VKVFASAPARADLAGGTLDLWPLHVLHPGTVTVNIAIGLFASCRVSESIDRFRVRAADGSFDRSAPAPAGLLDEPRTALVGSILEALEIRRPLDVELATQVPFGSGIGGSSALVVALLGALERFSPRDLSGVDRVDFVRDVETRVLGKPAGVQDYYPALEGGLHAIVFKPGATRAERWDVDASAWARHLTLFDTGAAHSSGMNNWEVLRARLEGDARVAGEIEGVRRAARVMADAAVGPRPDFPAMGRALGEEWSARRRLAPVVSTPAIETAIERSLAAGAWAGKACGAGGGGFVVVLSPEEATPRVRSALAALARQGAGRVVEAEVVSRGLEVREN
jgi:D-glycero-alpha-D-manno-heptose-7-phosphate kinase